jgi:hypothetical protein
MPRGRQQHTLALLRACGEIGTVARSSTRSGLDGDVYIQFGEFNELVTLRVGISYSSHFQLCMCAGRAARNFERAGTLTCEGWAKKH